MDEKELSTAKTLSIVSLITSILGVSLVGIITGHISLGKFKKLGVTEGKGMATAGLVLGYIGIAVALLFIIGGVVAGIAAASNPEIIEQLDNAVLQAQ